MHSYSEQAGHPLAETLLRVSSFDENYQAKIGPLEADWFLASELTQPESITLQHAVDRQASNYPQAKSRTRGSYFIGEYSWYVPIMAVAAFVAERRVPDLSPENVALRFSTYTWHEGGESGEAERIEVRFLSGRFAVLPDDDAANHPDAIILPDIAALRDWLRTSLEAHLTPLIEQVHQLTRLSRHAQWCLVADSCAAAFLYIGQALDDKSYATAEGLEFVKAAGSPMNNPKTGYITLEYQGHCETFRERGGCCLYYTIAEEHEKCSTCVLRKPQERETRLLAYMQRKYEQVSS